MKGLNAVTISHVEGRAIEEDDNPKVGAAGLLYCSALCLTGEEMSWFKTREGILLDYLFICPVLDYRGRIVGNISKEQVKEIRS
jgi:hypothetical protein